jgi:cytidine deaminase
MKTDELVKRAFDARRMSYSPYSHFAVGAALLTKSGKIFLGCNIENAAYSPTNCAERTAFFKAVSEGEYEFEEIAICGGLLDEFSQGKEYDEYCSPCGVCRQVMMEFCNPLDFKVTLAKSMKEYKTLTLEELLPLGFGPKNVKTLCQF